MLDKGSRQHKLLQHHFGDVPSEWSVSALGDIFLERIELNTDLISHPLYSFTIEKGVTPKTERYERSFLLRNKDENKYKLVHPKDFVVNPMNLRFGAIGYSRVNQIVSVSAYYDVFKLKDARVDIDFLEELLSSRRMFNIYNRIAIGSLVEKQRVHSSEFKKLRIFFPPKHEQRQIGDVIRCSNRRIAATEKLIKAKVKMKKGLIQQLLTGRKRFPEYANQIWISKTFEEIFQFLPTGSNPRADLSRSGKVKYIHYGDIHTKWQLFLDCQDPSIPFIGKEKVEHLPFLKEGDLVLVDASEDHDGLGLCVEIRNVQEDEIVAGLHTLLLRGNKRLAVDGFKGYITSIKAVNDEFKRIATGTKVYGISQTNLKSVVVSLPPLAEQKKISALLGVFEREIDLLQATLMVLKKQKSGLIGKLIIGELRVRSRHEGNELVNA